MKIKSLPKKVRRRIYTETTIAAASLIAIGSDRPDVEDAVVLAIGDTMRGEERAPDKIADLMMEVLGSRGPT